MLKEEIAQVLLDALKSGMPVDFGEDLEVISGLLADASAAYIHALTNEDVSASKIGEEFLAQCEVAFEEVRFGATQFHFGKDEVLNLLTRLIPIVVRYVKF